MGHGINSLNLRVTVIRGIDPSNTVANCPIGEVLTLICDLLTIVLHEMSQILNCGLDQRTLSILASLIENGVNPEALAGVVKELKRETDALRVSHERVY